MRQSLKGHGEKFNRFYLISGIEMDSELRLLTQVINTGKIKLQYPRDLTRYFLKLTRGLLSGSASFRN